MASSLYLKLVRRSHRFLRSKLMRRFPWVVKLVKPLFKREYWVASPHRMALGLSIGLFFAFALMIVPVQMLLAALACLYLRANLPLSVGACWITNPITVPPLVFLSVWFGEKVSLIGINVGDATWTIPLTEVSVNYAHFLIGSISLGVILAMLAYPLFMLISAFLPKRA